MQVKSKAKNSRIPGGVTLGQFVKGSRGSGIRAGRQVVLSPDQLRQNVAILGEGPDEGHRIASLLFEEAMDRDTQVFFLDGDGITGPGSAFLAAAKRAGREQFDFPALHFDVWAQLPAEYWIWQLLPSGELEAIGPKVDTGQILYVACDLNGERVRSHAELLANLDYEKLCAACDDEMLRGVTREGVEQLHAYFQEFFDKCPGSFLDGKRSFRDLDCAYFTFDERGGAVMRMLLWQLMHYIREEMDPDRPCVLFIRLPQGGDVYSEKLLELARNYGVSLVWFVPTQALAMRKKSQMARLLDDTGTLIVQSHAAWHEVKTLLGLPARERRSGSGTGLRKRKITKDDLLELSGGRVLVIGKDGEMLVDRPHQPLISFEYA